MKKSILVVDDQADIRRLIRLTASQCYSVREACSGDTAVSEIKVCKPEAVVLDIMMPGELDGLDVLGLIKSNATTHSIFVVMVSAKGQPADIDRALQAGADAYLVKPFSPLQLLRLLQEHIGY